MKGYYLFAPVEKENYGPDSGVERKVRSQHKALDEALGCELVILPPVEYTGSKLEKVIRRLPFTAAWRKWKYRGEFDDADYLYIREPYYDDTFVRYLKALKKSNPTVKVILEIPTYPPQPKNWSVSAAPFILKDMLCGPKAAKFVDAIVNYYGYQTIWKKPCITTINGYDFGKVTLPKRKRGNDIIMLSVALTAYWHGYDRVIEGLHAYYRNGGQENFIYHMVGNVIEEHEKKIREYGLEKNVILHGKMFGRELDALYEESFLGLDVLGGHRKKYPISSSLKSREYGAWGMPIITSSPVDYLPRDSKYQFVAPYDDSPLDFEAISKYYHSLFDGTDCNALAREIRENAQKHCDMPSTMQPIIDWILKN